MTASAGADGTQALVVERLVAGYDDRAILDDVSLTAARGEIVVVCGGSGSGKSTLLRCIVGLLAPRTGRVLIAGRDLYSLKPHERDEALRGVGLAFQSAALLNSLTVAENVALPIRERSPVDEATALMLARMRLVRVGLVGVGDRLPSEVPPEVRKRAGIARAMALDPPLLLLDEPTTGLDPNAGRALDQLVLDVRRETGSAIVVVSHDVSSIETIADRVTMLDRGRVVAAGTLAEVQASPDDGVQAFFARRAPGAVSTPSVLDELERGSVPSPAGGG
jgi:phospholipid/cholesterol/gamma-HCH transport system ATP-binding protein